MLPAFTDATEAAMSQGFGREVPTRHVQGGHREVTKYLVVIAAPEGPIAKLLLPDREQVAELDANTEEITAMTKGLTPAIGAMDTVWDKLLAGHSPEERAAAKVYTLER
jgi:hypothetical protein